MIGNKVVYSRRRRNLFTQSTLSHKGSNFSVQFGSTKYATAVITIPSIDLRMCVLCVLYVLYVLYLLHACVCDGCVLYCAVLLYESHMLYVMHCCIYCVYCMCLMCYTVYSVCCKSIRSPWERCRDRNNVLLCCSWPPEFPDKLSKTMILRLFQPTKRTHLLEVWDFEEVLPRCI